MPDATCRICRKQLGSTKGLNSHYGQTSCGPLLRELIAEERRLAENPSREPAAQGNEPDEPEDLCSNVHMADVQEDDPPADAEPPKQQDRRPTVEEVEDDEDAPGASRWYEDYPGPAGMPLQGPREFPDKQTTFDRIRTEQSEANLPPWHPFESKDDWELAQWLVRAGVSQSKIEEFLKLEKVRTSYSRLALVR